jgi:hypothetical protein
MDHVVVILREQVGEMCSGSCAQHSARTFFAQATTLAFGRTTPDAELFFVVQRVLEALSAHHATRAHGTRGLGRTAALRKEDLGIDVCASGVHLPVERL